MSDVTSGTVKLHSDLGASSSERWWNCPGSVALIRKLGERPTSYYAAEGTVAHSVAEAMVRRMLMNDPTMLLTLPIGKVVEVDGHEVEIDDDMYDAAYEYVAVIKQIVDKYNLLPEQIQLEVRISIPDASPEGEDMFGTADCMIVIPMQRVIVIDFKYGRGKRVKVEGNKQLMYYGVGGWLAVPDYMRDDIDLLELVIVQPRLSDGVTRVEMPINLVKQFHQDLKAAAARVTPDAPRIAGTWCSDNFCPARGPNCPESHKNAVELARVDFSSISLPAVINTPTLPDPRTVTDEQIALVLENKKHLEDYLEQYVVEAHRRMEQRHGAIPRHKLVRKKANRKWADEAAVAEKFGGRAYAEPKLLSPAQLEKVVGKEAVKPFAITPEGGITVAHIDDKRPEVIPAIADLQGIVIDADAVDVL